MRIRPTLPSFAFLLDSASAARSFPNLRCIHTLLIITGLSSSDFLRSKLCSAYAACGHLPEASHIFSRANRRPTFLYNSLLRSLADLHRYTSALLLFQTMLSDTAAPDHRTLSAVLRSCAGIPSPGHGCSVHALAAAVGLADHLAVSNSLISMYSKCGDLETAREVFDRMPERDLVTWTAMIGGCGDHGVPMEDLVEGMLACCGGRLDGEAMTVVLAACVRNGLTELGVSVFDAMMEGRFGEVRPSVEHYTCMVELLGRAGRVEEVENLVISMQAEPDEALCRALLVLRAGLAERGHCSVS